jgi:hypothetical protein
MTKIAALAIILTGLASCNLINPKEEIPSYLHVSDYTVDIDTVNQGTANQKFSDVWITVEGTNLGGYEIPATVPALHKGITKVFIYPGVRQNGLSITRAIYPFMKAFDTVLNLNEKIMDSIKPVFSYIPGTKFTWLENFNGTNPSVTLGSNSFIPFHYTTDKDSAFEGSSLVAKFSTDSNQIFECQSKYVYNLPRARPVYLELNYYNEVPMTVGIYSVNGSMLIKTEVIGLNPLKRWNKVYIDLSEVVSSQPDGSMVAVYFRSVKTRSDAGRVIMLDNIKMLNLE